MPTIDLRPIDRNNFSAVLALAPTDAQKDFIAPNIYSLAEAKAKPECVPLAICLDGTPVGFAMYCMDQEDAEYWVYRFMIDKTKQGKGYGRAAFKCLMERIAADQTHSKIYISFEPNNFAARCLYESFGFHPDGRVIDGEEVYLWERPN